MQAIVVFVMLALGLFALAFLTKRRFGVLGLALCAGALLSASWADTLTPLLQQQGITLLSPPLASVVAALLILLPPVILLLGGPAYTKLPGRIVGALLFTLLATVFLLGPLGAALVFDTASLGVYAALGKWSNAITATCIIAALVDTVLARSPGLSKHKPGH